MGLSRRAAPFRNQARGAGGARPARRNAKRERELGWLATVGRKPRWN